tara:strand:+ start:1365 stop:1889 length:525 start_codon:yes stop_codon:yes gene_type:complete
MKTIIGLTLLLSLSSNAQQSENLLKLGSEFPNFELEELNGSKLSSSSLTGKVVFINLWFTSCVPCIEEMPELNKLAEAYKDKVEFLSITFDDVEKVETFLKSRDFGFRHLVNASGFLKNELQNKSYPRNIIITRKGEIALVNDGLPFTRDEVTGEMKPLPYTYFGKSLDKALSE